MDYISKYSGFIDEDYDEKDFTIDSKEVFMRIYVLLRGYGYNKDNFTNNLKTLKIKKISPIGIVHGSYNPLFNKLCYYSDANLVHELLHLASTNIYKSTSTGITTKSSNKKEFAKGLNEGITDYFTSLITNENGAYPFEKICAKALVVIMPNKENIFTYYFNNDPEGFLKLDTLNMMKLIHSLDKYHNLMNEIYNDLNNELIPKEEVLKKLNYYFYNVIEILYSMYLKYNTDINYFSTYLNKELYSEEMKPIYDIINMYDNIKKL